MHKGLIRVSYDLLREALCLPEDTIILAVRDAQDNFRIEHGAFFEIKLVHPDLRDVNEFEMLPFYEPQFKDTEYIHAEFDRWI